MIRLNRGCGDKILPGYVNVDVAPSRARKQHDVICDLHQLKPFEDASADEVLAVHVVEHFWRWEVVDVLREWARVLKPGAPMILECPNLAATQIKQAAAVRQQAVAQQVHENRVVAQLAPRKMPCISARRRIEPRRGLEQEPKLRIQANRITR
jgi:predicted SAM-dependent methyltransferase